MTLALNWKLALIVALVILLATLITDYIAIGTVTTIVVVPAYLGIANGSLVLTAILCVGTLVMLGKHRENLARIVKREEIGLRSTIRGDKRIR